MRGYIIRFALAAASLALLYYFGLLRFEALTALYDQPGRVAIAALLLLLTIPLGALRWHLLLRCQGFLLPFRKTLEVVLVGQFFNTFLPGAYGGDIVRAGYIYHGARQQAGKLLFSILIDRLTGLTGLIALGLAAQLLLPSAMDFRLTLFMVALVAAVVGGLCLLPLISRWTTAIAQRFSGLLGERVLQLSMQLTMAIEIYRKRADVVIVAVVISALQFALILAAFVVLANAFDFATAKPSTIIYAGVVSLIANSVPLTPGGIGVGEAAFANTVILIDPLAAGPYATIFLASRALTLLLNLLGGLVFLAYRSEIIEYTAESRGAEKPQRVVD